MTLEHKEYEALIRKLARYEAALNVISVLGKGANLDIDGWYSMSDQSRTIATKALAG